MLELLLVLILVGRPRCSDSGADVDQASLDFLKLRIVSLLGCLLSCAHHKRILGASQAQVSIELIDATQ